MKDRAAGVQACGGLRRPLARAGSDASDAPVWINKIVSGRAAELAERMGVDRAYVSGLELGQRNPTIVTLWHLAEALSVKLQLFFDDSPRSRAR